MKMYKGIECLRRNKVEFNIDIANSKMLSGQEVY